MRSSRRWEPTCSRWDPGSASCSREIPGREPRSSARASASRNTSDMKSASRAPGDRPALLGRWLELRNDGADLLPMMWRDGDARQPERKHAYCRQVRADAIDEKDVRAIGERTERGCGDAADAERHAKKEARNHPDATGHQLLRIDDDHRERR